MTKTGKLRRVLPVCLLCLAASAVFWGWIFTFITDTGFDRKISVYYSPSLRADETLAARLEEQLPEGIRMVKVRSFEYFMFGTEDLEKGDLYIVKESECGQYLSFFRSLPAEAASAFGDRLYVYTDAQSGAAVTGLNLDSGGYFSESFPEGERLILFFGGKSAHAEDRKAMYALQTIMNGYKEAE